MHCRSVGVRNFLYKCFFYEYIDNLAQKARTVSSKRSNYQKTRCTSCSYPDFGLHMFQGKVTLKSRKSSERNAISLADKAKPKAEIQVLKKRALYIPEQIISAEICFGELVRVN